MAVEDNYQRGTEVSPETLNNIYDYVHDGEDEDLEEDLDWDDDDEWEDYDEEDIAMAEEADRAGSKLARSIFGGNGLRSVRRLLGRVGRRALAWAGIGSSGESSGSSAQAVYDDAEMLEASAGPAVLSGGRTQGALTISRGLMSRSPVPPGAVPRKQGRHLGLYGSAAVLAGLIVFVGLRRRD